MNFPDICKIVFFFVISLTMADLESFQITAKTNQVKSLAKISIA